MRKCLCYILLIIFCVQLLPLQSVGKILYSQAIQEEIPHTDDKPVEKSTKGLDIYYLHNIHSVIAENISYRQMRHLALFENESKLLAHWLETFSPPPEFS